ncbi:MAG: type 4a pilus biogenesis protein PilO [Patescibacteria group bacterium]
MENEPTKAPSKFFTEYYVVAFLFLIAAFVGTAIFVHRPLITEIKRLNADTQSKLQEAQNERTYLKSVEGSVTAAQSIPSGVLQAVDQALPTDQNIPSLLVQLGAAALRNNVRIDSVAFNEKAQPTTGQALPTGMISPMDISLAIRASSYFEMKRFLVSIENSLRIMDILTLLSSGGDAGGETTYSIQLRTYSYIPPLSRTATP